MDISAEANELSRSRLSSKSLLSPFFGQYSTDVVQVTEKYKALQEDTFLKSKFSCVKASAGKALGRRATSVWAGLLPSTHLGGRPGWDQSRLEFEQSV